MAVNAYYKICIYQIKAVLILNPEKMNYDYKYLAAQLFSTLIIRNISWVANSEGSCDTESAALAAENSALLHGNKLHFKIYTLDCNNISQYNSFTVFGLNKCLLGEHISKIVNGICIHWCTKSSINISNINKNKIWNVKIVLIYIYI